MPKNGLLIDRQKVVNSILHRLEHVPGVSFVRQEAPECFEQSICWPSTADPLQHHAGIRVVGGGDGDLCQFGVDVLVWRSVLLGNPVELLLHDWGSQGNHLPCIPEVKNSPNRLESRAA